MRERSIAPFAACGVELEYALVDAASGDVKPAAQALLQALWRRTSGGAVGVDRDRHPTGDAIDGSRCSSDGRAFSGDVEDGEIGWSNELVAHVVELKNPRPVADLRLLDRRFADAVATMNEIAAEHGVRLLPSAMHPWMDPRRETRLWSDDPNRIYSTYDRIFDCRRHGWSNLQSMHVNLPFDDERSFVALHDAIRLVLPILPALAASSPFADGRATGWLDWRLETYRTNAAAFPSITGPLVPETVDSRDDYAARILAPMYREISGADPDGVLAHEWLNSRGAIARFDRSAIEIRVIDMQECPRADLAIAVATTAVVREIYDGAWSDARARRLPSARLATLLLACARDGERAILDDADYLACFGLPRRRCEARELWEHLVHILAVPASTSTQEDATAGALATAEAGPGPDANVLQRDASGPPGNAVNAESAGSADHADRAGSTGNAGSARPAARAQQTGNGPPDPIGRGIAAEWLPPLEHILDAGPLARRMLAAVSPPLAMVGGGSRATARGEPGAGDAPPRVRLAALASALCDCLASGRQFDGLD